MEPSLEPVEYDVLVAGGGTAGCAAAIAAARRGRRVLLVEETNALGGVSATGCVSEWFAGTDGVGDVFAGVKRELENYGAVSGRFYNGEHLKIVWQVLAEEAGVDILLNASLVEARPKDGRLVGATVISCSRPVDVKARYFIDCTGEGDLGALAGAEFMKGHPETGQTLSMTLAAVLCETGRPVEPYLPAGVEPVQSEEDLPLALQRRFEDTIATVPYQVARPE